MFRYVDLCVELKKGRYAKDGLIHYRNVCQQVNVSSLEEVIKYFLKTATNKAEAAQSKAAEVISLFIWISSTVPCPARFRCSGFQMLQQRAACTMLMTQCMLAPIPDCDRHSKALQTASYKVLGLLPVLLQALVSIDVEDLEVDATPEDLMLSYVSGEKGKVSNLILSSLHGCPCMPIMCFKAFKQAAHVGQAVM
jgi:predicted metal-binding protein